MEYSCLRMETDVVFHRLSNVYGSIEAEQTQTDVHAPRHSSNTQNLWLQPQWYPFTLLFRGR